MEITEKEGRWFARKNKKAKTLEDVTDIIKFDGDFCSVMGKAGRTEFHSYLGKVNGRWTEMYGVTSLLNYWGEKENLLQWAVNQAVDCVQEANACYNELTREVMHYQVPPSLLQEARSAHKKSLKDAGDHGTDRHALVEKFIGAVIKGDVSVPFDESIKEFVEWSIGHTFIASEMPLRSAREWCAGTADGVVEIDGKTYIFDLKTSNYVSYKNFVQCGAYALMYEEMGKGKIDGLIIVHMPRGGGFNVHIDTDVAGYKEDFRQLVRLVKRDKNKSYQLYS